MLASYALDPNETLLLNLTDTLLGRDYDQQTLFCQNIGIKRRLSNLTFLYSEVAPDKTRLEHSTSKKIIQPQEPYLDVVIYASVGSSKIAILPEKLSDMLKKGWSYSSRLELLWGAFSYLNEGAGGDSIVCFPESNSGIENNREFGLPEVLKPIGLNHQKVGDNLMLCNPGYCPFVIAEPGMSQAEFTHLEFYLRNGGNLLLSADNAVFEEKNSAIDCSPESITEDKMCLNLIIENKA